MYGTYFLASHHVGQLSSAFQPALYTRCISKAHEKSTKVLSVKTNGVSKLSIVSLLSLLKPIYLMF